jgi:Protein of unknown function (DUF2946)
VYGFFCKRLLQKRLIALAAAYAIALAGLVANLGGAQMAAAGAQPGGILCHSDLAGSPGHFPDGGTDSVCLNNCCTGCLLLMAALPPPPEIAIALAPVAGERITPLAAALFVASPQTYSHRSRAPPLKA